MQKFCRLHSSPRVRDDSRTSRKKRNKRRVSLPTVASDSGHYRYIIQVPLQPHPTPSFSAKACSLPVPHQMPPNLPLHPASDKRKEFTGIALWQSSSTHRKGVGLICGRRVDCFPFFVDNPLGPIHKRPSASPSSGYCIASNAAIGIRKTRM